MTALEIYRHFKANLALIRPQLVIIQLGNNLRGPSMFYSLDRGSPRQMLAAALNASRLFRSLKLLRDAGWACAAGDLDLRRIYSDVYLVNWHKTAVPQLDHSLDQQKRVIEKMAGMVRSQGGRVVLCGYFDSGANAMLRALAAKTGAPFCDVEPVLKRRGAVGTADRFLSEDGWHPNARGYALIAEELFQLILREALGPAAFPDATGGKGSAGPAEQAPR